MSNITDIISNTVSKDLDVPEIVEIGSNWGMVYSNIRFLTLSARAFLNGIENKLIIVEEDIAWSSDGYRIHWTNKENITLKEGIYLTKGVTKKVITLEKIVKVDDLRIPDGKELIKSSMDSIIKRIEIKGLRSGPLVESLTFSKISKLLNPDDKIKYTVNIDYHIDAMSILENMKTEDFTLAACKHKDNKAICYLYDDNNSGAVVMPLEYPKGL